MEEPPALSLIDQHRGPWVVHALAIVAWREMFWSRQGTRRYDRIAGSGIDNFFSRIVELLFDGGTEEHALRKFLQLYSHRFTFGGRAKA